MLKSSEGELGRVVLGPHELFGGEPQPPGPNLQPRMLSVPGDPLDACLTHWGLALRRKAKVEMWHRLQI